MALPAIVCAAFSAEVGLKTILARCGITAKGHDLKALYSSLPKHLQLQIQEGTCLAELEFKKLLEESRLAFVEWRYVFERESYLKVNVGFLGTLASVIQAVSTRMGNAV
jgi:HEPN domain-containing protein